jgi:hypothetical protein
MTLKEYAEDKGITLEEAKKETGLTHWKQEVVADAPSVEAPVAEKSVEEVVVEEVGDVVASAKDLLKESQDVMKVLMKDGITAEKALIGIRMIGKKSKYYPFVSVLETLVD